MAAPGRPILAAPLPTSVSPGTDIFTTSAGLAGWWDAGVASGMLDATGRPLAAFNAAAAAVADRSGAGRSLSVWHAAGTNGSAPMATPRLNGLLGGIGLNRIVPPNLPGAGQ
ncbi:MAG TPA: hypothetical protein VE690_19565, partial [Rhodopila sp.]|nr:hypothetical protein [Rhodopila sp.]